MYTLINGTKLNTAEEMKQTIGDLSQLQTEDKSSIVSAINEITISGNVDRIARQLINNEINRATTAEAELSSSISLENDRASAAENVLNTKIIDLKNNIYTKQEADSLLDDKANTSEVYTKQEADSLLDDKANTSEVYTKQETDRLLDGKVNAADFYTKQEADSLLDDKANAVDVYTKQEADSLLDDKANTSNVYTKQETDALLNSKANTSDIYTKQETDSLLDTKANTLDVYTKQETSTLLNAKANTIDVYSKLETNSLLLNKANTTDVYTKQVTDTKITELIDDSIISTSKTWSSEKIASKTSYPEGYVYQQLYNPTSKTWEKDPSQLGMTPASGCRWEEITGNFAGYPYLKIGSRTTQDGHNAYHSHTGGNLKIEGELGTVSDGSKQAFFTMDGWAGWSKSYHPGYDSYAAYTNNNGHSNIHHNGTNWSGSTSYDGSSTEQTVEVNASGMKIWKVVADT